MTAPCTRCRLLVAAPDDAAATLAASWAKMDQGQAVRVANEVDPVQEQAADEHARAAADDADEHLVVIVAALSAEHVIGMAVREGDDADDDDRHQEGEVGEGLESPDQHRRYHRDDGDDDRYDKQVDHFNLSQQILIWKGGEAGAPRPN